MTQTTLALNSQWLDNSTFNASGGTFNANLTVTPAATIVWPNYVPQITPWVPYVAQSYCYHYEGPTRPIKLTLSEVERLRAAAKRDAKLKAILAKFTECIQIEVDFE